MIRYGDIEPGDIFRLAFYRKECTTEIDVAETNLKIICLADELNIPWGIIEVFGTDCVYMSLPGFRQLGRHIGIENIIDNKKVLGILFIKGKSPNVYYETYVTSKPKYVEEILNNENIEEVVQLLKFFPCSDSEQYEELKFVLHSGYIENEEAKEIMRSKLHEFITSARLDDITLFARSLKILY